MKELLSGVLALALAVPVQRIETEQPNRGTVKRVETAMNHLTVIELAEPVVMAAAGSPSFKIERQGNKVLIQPLEEDASTNLFIWTASDRFSYELVPAASVETMHFAIDQNVRLQAEANPPAQAPPDEKQEPLGAILRSGNPIRVLGSRADSSQVGIVITDVFEREDQIVIRYTVDNRTRHAYVMREPEVFALQHPKSPISLLALRHTQIDTALAKSIRSQGEQPLSIVDSHIAASIVHSGERKPGLLSLRFEREDSQPAVLRVVFHSSGSTNSIALTLVL
jgi:hypothetical protein